MHPGPRSRQVKQLHAKRLPDKLRQDFFRECAIMQQLRHPNVVLFIGSVVTETKVRRVPPAIVHVHVSRP